MTISQHSRWSALVFCSALLGACAGGETVDGVRHVRVVSIERELPFAADDIWQQVMLDYGGAAKFNPKVVDSGYLGDIRRPVVGAQRYMYYDPEGQQGIHERIELLDPINRRIRFRVFEARDLPIDTEATYGESQLVPIDENRTKFQMSFYFRTQPRFMGGFAERQIRRDLTNMAAGIEYYLTTGESASAQAIQDWLDE